jgi:hypothetical protein
MFKLYNVDLGIDIGGYSISPFLLLLRGQTYIIYICVDIKENVFALPPILPAPPHPFSLLSISGIHKVDDR